MISSLDFSKNSSFVDKVLASSIAAATPLMAAYGVGANPVAVTAATVAYAQNLNKFTAEIYAFAPYASQLKRHVKDQNDRLFEGNYLGLEDGKVTEFSVHLDGWLLQ